MIAFKFVIIFTFLTFQNVQNGNDETIRYALSTSKPTLNPLRYLNYQNHNRLVEKTKEIFDTRQSNLCWYCLKPSQLIDNCNYLLVLILMTRVMRILFQTFSFAFKSKDSTSLTY